MPLIPKKLVAMAMVKAIMGNKFLHFNYSVSTKKNLYILMLDWYSKYFIWAKQIFLVGISQTFLQIIGFFTGLFILRTLTIKEYAIYTIANTMLGSLAVLTDSGISNSVMNQGSKVWKIKNKLGEVLVTGLLFRKKVAIPIYILVAGILIGSLLKQNASIYYSFLVALAILPAFYAGLSDTLYEIPLKLNANFKYIQINQIKVGVLRLIFTITSLFFFPFTIFAILAAGISRYYGNFDLRKVSLMYWEKSQPANIEVYQQMKAIVIKVFPNTLFYVFSGQITLFILSFLGNNADVAQFGALGRFSVILIVFTSIISTLFVPKFAKLPADKGKLVLNFIYCQIAVFIFITSLYLLVLIFPSEILWILGSKYSNLNIELSLFFLSSCLGLAFQIAGNLLSNRGLIINSYVLIFVSVFCLIVSIKIFDIGSIVGILKYQILTNSLYYLISLFYFFKYANSLKAIE